MEEDGDDAPPPPPASAAGAAAADQTGWSEYLKSAYSHSTDDEDGSDDGRQQAEKLPSVLDWEKEQRRYKEKLEKVDLRRERELCPGPQEPHRLISLVEQLSCPLVSVGESMRPRRGRVNEFMYSKIGKQAPTSGVGKGFFTEALEKVLCPQDGVDPQRTVLRFRTADLWDGEVKNTPDIGVEWAGTEGGLKVQSVTPGGALELAGKNEVRERERARGHEQGQCSVTVQKESGSELGAVWERNSTVLESVQQDSPLSMLIGPVSGKLTGLQVVRVNGKTVFTAKDIADIAEPAAEVRLEFKDPQLPPDFAGRKLVRVGQLRRLGKDGNQEWQPTRPGGITAADVTRAWASSGGNGIVLGWEWGLNDTTWADITAGARRGGSPTTRDRWRESDNAGPWWQRKRSAHDDADHSFRSPSLSSLPQQWASSEYPRRGSSRARSEPADTRYRPSPFPDGDRGSPSALHRPLPHDAPLPKRQRRLASPGVRSVSPDTADTENEHIPRRTRQALHGPTLRAPNEKVVENHYYAGQCEELLRQIHARDSLGQYRMPLSHAKRKTQMMMKLPRAQNEETFKNEFNREMYCFDIEMKRFNDHATLTHLKRCLEKCIALSKKHIPKPLRPMICPIIMVPSAMMSAVNIHNAKSFLGSAKWEDPNLARQRRVQEKDDGDQVRMRIKRPEFPFQEFLLKCDPSTLTHSHEPGGHSDWDYVCMVVFTGHTWQLEGFFPSKKKGGRPSEPREVFDRVPGYHFAYEDEQFHPNVTKWRCDAGRVSKVMTKRHKDLVVVEGFWKCLAARMPYHPSFQKYFEAHRSQR